MKKRLWILVLILITILAGVYWKTQRVPGTFVNSQKSPVPSEVWYCPMHPNYISDRPGDCPICNMKLVKREVDPPSPENHSAPLNIARDEPLKSFSVEELIKLKPGEICLLHKCKMGTCLMAMTPEFAQLGKCPHCGEDLGIIVKGATPAGYADVKLNAEKQGLIGIKTAPVQKGPMIKAIRTVGRIAYDPELYQAQEEYLQAYQALKKAEQGTLEEIKSQAARLLDSAKIKLRLLGLSEDLMGEISQRATADRSLLYSDPGGTVWLYAPIYEYELPQVKVGDKIQVEVPAMPGEKFVGIIRSIDSVLDPMTRSARARAVLDNPKGVLKPEMYVNATLESKLESVLSVPEEAVFTTGERSLLFVEKEKGVFEPREVMVGAKSAGRAEIKSGVQEGESVVTSGNFLIDSESRLKAALEGAGGSGSGGAHQHGA